MENENIVIQQRELEESLRKEQEKSIVETAILKNNLEFKIDNILYRITKPTFGHKQELVKAKAKKLKEMLKDSDYVFKKDLKLLYLSKNIDIDDMENNLKNLEIRKKSLKEKLGELLTKKVSESDYIELKDEIILIELSQQELNSKLTEFLEFCVEQQLLIFSYSYLIMLTVEVRKDDKWIRLWNNYDEFNNTEEKLINQIALYASLIIKDDV